MQSLPTLSYADVYADRFCTMLTGFKIYEYQEQKGYEGGFSIMQVFKPTRKRAFAIFTVRSNRNIWSPYVLSHYVLYAVSKLNRAERHWSLKTKRLTPPSLSSHGGTLCLKQYMYYK